MQVTSRVYRESTEVRKGGSAFGSRGPQPFLVPHWDWRNRETTILCNADMHSSYFTHTSDVTMSHDWHAFHGMLMYSSCLSNILSTSFLHNDNHIEWVSTSAFKKLSWTKFGQVRVPHTFRTLLTYMQHTTDILFTCQAHVDYIPATYLSTVPHPITSSTTHDNSWSHIP
jgi:hypothetical protein